MLTIIFIVLILLIIGGLVAAAKINADKETGKKGTISAKIPVTKNEQPMYFQLREAFPEHVVLAQVSFSAVLQTKDRATRNTFDRKVADFVICNKAFDVIAFVELDDASHNGKEISDSKRDSLLTSAGYKVFRYKRVPDVQTLVSDITPGSIPTIETATGAKMRGGLVHAT
jgi:very-short-patch-repair endonuclease